MGQWPLLPLANSVRNSHRMSTIYSPDERRQIAEAVFPDHAKFKTIAELEAQFPERKLAPGAMVTRVAPSPTGMMHMGSLYMAMINSRLSAQSHGVFILRIEDTDQNRLVPGAIDSILNAFVEYGIEINEGLTRKPDGSYENFGNYGPYLQSKRREIYHAVAFDLIKRGLIYPCFLTADELKSIRDEQQKLGMRPGVYGRWALGRMTPAAEVITKIETLRPQMVLRLAPPKGTPEEVVYTDGARGEIKFPKNDVETVLIKSDGLPMYPFAMLVDDHLMRITDVIRGDEWIASMPLHLQLFEAAGWRPPRYAHVAPIQKQEGGAKRKISKRKDPEAAVSYFWQQGFVREAVLEYLLNLANSTFEDWRRDNPDKAYNEFELKIENLGVAGPLFDPVKLENISRQVLTRMSSAELLEISLRWAREFEPELAAEMVVDTTYTEAVLNIERSNEKAAKRLSTLADLRTQVRPFFDKFLPPVDALPFPESMDVAERCRILKLIRERYSADILAGEVFGFLQQLAGELGYAQSVKEFKAEPGKFRGHVGDVAMVARVTLFGDTKTPDLGEMMTVLGPERVRARCQRVL